jgi:hypothetical protein
MSDCESISGSEISFCDSESAATESIASTESGTTKSSTKSEYRPGYATVSLCSCLRNENSQLITEENKDTFIQTPESVLLSVEEWGPSIYYVRDEFITYELCRKAIENNEDSICSIKPHLITKDEYYSLCLESVTQNGFNLKFIAKDVQGQELVDAAIKKCCWAIKYARDEFKTYENCLSAVTTNGATIQHVPSKFQTKEMCEEAVKVNYYCLKYIPKEHITKELCETAVKSYGENIKDVPDEFMSTELAFIAIQPNSNYSDTTTGSNIQFIPAKYITRELILESVRSCCMTYSTIPKECITEEIEDEVLDISPYTIQHMKQTPERCMRAIKSDPYVLCSEISIESITPEIAEHIRTLPKKTKKNIKRYYKKYYKKEEFEFMSNILS